MLNEVVVEGRHRRLSEHRAQELDDGIKRVWKVSDIYGLGRYSCVEALAHEFAHLLAAAEDIPEVDFSEEGNPFLYLGREVIRAIDYRTDYGEHDDELGDENEFDALSIEASALSHWLPTFSVDKLAGYVKTHKNLQTPENRLLTTHEIRLEISRRAYNFENVGLQLRELLLAADANLRRIRPIR